MPTSATAIYHIVAVRYATLHAHRSALFHRYEAYGAPDREVEMAYFEMAYYFWVLFGTGETILLDTGFDPAARRGRTTVCQPLEALQRLGVDPASVSTVVVTHLWGA